MFCPPKRHVHLSSGQVPEMSPKHCFWKAHRDRTPPHPTGTFAYQTVSRQYDCRLTIPVVHRVNSSSYDVTTFCPVPAVSPTRLTSPPSRVLLSAGGRSPLLPPSPNGLSSPVAATRLPRLCNLSQCSPANSTVFIAGFIYSWQLYFNIHQ